MCSVFFKKKSCYINLGHFQSLVVCHEFGVYWNKAGRRSSVFFLVGLEIEP